MDALRPLRQGRGASRAAFPRRAWERSSSLRAPPQCTVNRNRAQQPVPNPALICNKNLIAKTQNPRNTGRSALPSDFLLQLVKNWHAPCNSPISDSIHYPVSGTLVQAGRGFPSLHRAHTATATSPPRFGVLGTGRPGIPSLHRAHDAMREPSRFGNLGTGRPGIPSFIALGDGSPAASGHRPRYRPTRPAVAGPPPPSATIPHHSIAFASSRPCR
ncbi:hypothetical protein PMI21_03482 [Pseudomonas sp. GM18]|nr:hypothetical protein PMI21_03482 [Pseudomonas sp. GM18]